MSDSNALAHLDVRVIDGSGPAIVFLHEGLGSVALWRSFPDDLCAALGGRPGLVWSRRGYGRSAARERPWPDSFMHEEADLLDVLLRAHAMCSPVLIGHSDGASIALLHASRFPARAVVSIAAHVVVEDVTVASIAALDGLGVRDRLERHHNHENATFDAWTDVWRRPSFREWDITSELAKVTCPVLAIQGTDDEYGTAAQLDLLERSLGGPTRRVEIAGAGHAPHVSHRAAVLHEIVRFLHNPGCG